MSSLPTTLPATYTSGGVRRFSDARIQAAVDSALAEAKPEDKVCVVAHHTFTGTENVTKLYAESFRGEEHLGRILDEARAIVDAAV